MTIAAFVVVGHGVEAKHVGHAGVSNGQRVPEDWHRLSAKALVQRALRAAASASWKLEANEVNLVFAGYGAATQGAAALHA